MIRNYFEKSEILTQPPGKNLGKFFRNKNEGIGKKYLAKNPDEIWDIKVKISEEFLGIIKESVKLTEFEILVLQREIETARKLKQKLTEKLVSQELELALEEGVILALAEHRRPGFYDKVEPIEYFVKEKSETSKEDLTHIKSFASILHSLNKHKKHLNFVKELIKCDKFLLELTEECEKKPKNLRKKSDFSEVFEDSTQLCNKSTGSNTGFSKSSSRESTRISQKNRRLSPSRKARNTVKTRSTAQNLH